jgi:uncharacterized phage protein gp47/JayE
MSTITYGLSASGFLAKPLSVIQSEIEQGLIDGLRDSEGNARLNVKTGVTSQITGPYASKARELWELAEAVHGAFDRDNASGAALDAVGAMTGSDRIPATKGTVIETVTLAAAMTLPAGSIVSDVGDPTSRWVTLEDVTSTTLGTYEVECECETAGPIAANAGALTVIETPVSGWTAAANAEDANQGTLEETDPDYRARQEDELAGQGTSPQDAVRADLLALLDEEEITDGSVTVAMNVGDVANGEGLPPHSIEAIVYDGTDGGTALTDDQIAQRLWDTVAAGIQTHGTSSGTATDSLGESHTVYFSRPTIVELYVSPTVSVATSRGWDATNGPTSIKAALVAFGRSTFGTGDDVARFRLMSAIFGVAGIVDVTAFTLGITASPVGTTNVVIGRRELAVFDTGRVVVVPNVVTPP